MMDESGSDQPATRRLTTLVVDDEHDLANVAAELLIYHGIDALVAYSAHEALRVMEARPDIDAVFSDVMMPSMTGLELAEVLTRVYPAVRIVLTSGFTALTYWDQAPCPYRFVKKPYSIDAVIRLLTG
jgi:two-component system OmpR family response regulator